MLQHSNAKTREENKDSVKAYAKIAGREWTYYVQTLHVNIGRPPDRDHKPDAQSSPIALAAQSLPEVHIDLGPSKFISRLHAEIFYDGQEPACWRVRVNGRNGLRLNNDFLRRGTDTQISCGDIIEIANTQMMFVTPAERPVIHPSFLQGEHRLPIGEEPPSWDSSNHAHPEMPGRRGSWTSNGRRPISSSDNNNTIPPDASQATAPVMTPPAKRHTTPRPTSRDTAEPPQANKSPLYNRGMMMESTEEIDYSDDSAKDLKPPYSYATMISQAIFSTGEEKMSLSNIYKFIMDNYAFYRHSQTGWQNSIRHNLSLNKAFQKIPRRTDEPGKGMKWQVVPEYRQEYLKKLGRKGNQSSAPSSPVGKENNNGNSSSFRSINGQSGMEKSFEGAFQVAKSSPQQHTTSPGFNSFSVAPVEAYTPDRGSKVAGRETNGRAQADYEDQQQHSPLPSSAQRNNNSGATRVYGMSDNVAGSPPVLSSSYYDDAPSTMITPAPLRQQPRLAPPSTAQIPSKFMPMSSPAQFWKFADIGSTPAKPMSDMSPLKPSFGGGSSATGSGAATGGDGRDGGRVGAGMNPVLPSSSPPPPNFVSPSKPGSSQRQGAVGEGEDKPPVRNWRDDDDDDDDEGNDGPGFDLARYVPYIQSSVPGPFFFSFLFFLSLLFWLWAPELIRFM